MKIEPLTSDEEERTVAYDMGHGGTNGIVYYCSYYYGLCEDSFSKCYIIEEIGSRVKMKFFNGHIEEGDLVKIIGDARATQMEFDEEMEQAHSSALPREEPAPKDDIPF